MPVHEMSSGRQRAPVVIVSLLIVVFSGSFSLLAEAEVFTLPFTDRLNTCQLSSIDVRAANATIVHWRVANSLEDAASNASREVKVDLKLQCQLKLIVSDEELNNAEGRELCDRLLPVADLLVNTSVGNHTFWHDGPSGQTHVVCLRPADDLHNSTGTKELTTATTVDPIQRNVSINNDWSFIVAKIPRRMPPALLNGNCSITGTLSNDDDVVPKLMPVERKLSYVYSESERVVISCNVTGWPSPTVYWCKQTFHCQPDTAVSLGNDLVIESAAHVHEGTYHLVAFNSHGRLHTAGYTLRMAVLKPLPRTGLVGTVEVGRNLELPCNGWLNSVPVAEVTWLRVVNERLNQKLEINERMAIVKGSLIFLSANVSDRGQYICRVYNEQRLHAELGNRCSVEVTASDYNLFPRQPETVDSSTTPRNQPVHSVRGNNVRLPCLMAGNPWPTIVWYRNERVLTAHDDPRYSWSAGNQTMDINDVSPDDHGEYRCVATNSEGTKSSTIELEVFAMPSFVTAPRSLNASVGDTVQFSCRAYGNPTPTIAWYFNGQPAFLSGLNISDRLSISGDKLTLTNVALGDTAVVQCNASNYNGFYQGSVVADAYLNVFKATKITEMSNAIKISRTRLGDITRPVRLQCGAVTDPLTQISVKWQLSSAAAAETSTDRCTSVQIAHPDNPAMTSVQLLDIKHGCCQQIECLATNGMSSDRKQTVVCWSLVITTPVQSSSDAPFYIANSFWTMIGIVSGASAVVIVIVCACFVRAHRRRKQLKSALSQSNPTMNCNNSFNSLRRGGSARSNGYDSSDVRDTVCFVNNLNSGGGHCCDAAVGGSPCQYHVGAVTCSTPSSCHTFGRRPTTLSRQASNFSGGGGSTDCLVCENSWLTTGPLGLLNEQLRAAIADMYVPREQVHLESTVGNGQFGRVFAAQLIKARGYSEHVAVKTMKFKPNELEMAELFLREAVIMKQFVHKNVLHIKGVTFDSDGSPMVILPFMANGDLRQYILNPLLDITILELLKLGHQVAEGMLYLSQRRFVHRDLAARNCMVDERRIVKVADFGLSRELVRDYYRSAGSGVTPVPVRWLAPECLGASVFTTMSDVWSFGVLLWELMTRGALPYHDVDNWQIVACVRSGQRLPKPEYCPDVIYRIMAQCWNDDAHERPSFEQLVTMLGDVIASGRPGAQSSSGLYQNIQTQPSPLQMQDLAENVEGKSPAGLANAAAATPETHGGQNVNSTTMATTV